MASDLPPRRPNDQSVTILQAAIVRATRGFSGELDRAQAVVADAVDRLVKSFVAIKDVAVSQREMLRDATGSLQLASGDDKASFGTTAKALARDYVDDMVRVSRDSVRILDQLSRLTESVDSITRRADSIERLAKETRFLALNARIETQRAGQAGRTFGVVAEEVKRLANSSGSLSEEIQKEVSLCTEALNQTSRTAESLAAHDMTTVVAQHKNLGASIAKLDEVNRVLETTLAEVDRAMSGAIQALQFQDMVSQLLASISQKVQGFGEIMGDAMAALASGRGNADQASVLSARIDALSKIGAVAQTSMTSGTVELF